MSYSIRCPKCSHRYRGGGKDNVEKGRVHMMRHLMNAHSMSKRGAERELEDIMESRQGQNIKDAIREYDEFIKSGVFVERTERKVIL